MSDLDFSAQGTPDDESGVPDFSGGGTLVAEEPEAPDFSSQGIPDDVQTSPPPARGVPVNAPTIAGIPLPDSMVPMTPAAATEASRAATVQATPEQRQASFQEIAAKTADLRRRIEIAERAGNKEGAQQLIQDLEAVAPGTVARQEKQNAQLRTLTKMGIGGAVAGPAALLTSTIAAPVNEAIMSREIDTDLPPSDSLAQYWKYGAQMFRGEAQIGSKQPQSIEDWMKIQEQDAKLTAAESKLAPGEGFFRKGIQALASSAPGMIDTLVQSGGFAPSSYKQWADQGTGAILREALRGRDVRSMSKEELDSYYFMAKGAGQLYAGVEFAQSPLALTKALGFDVGGQFVGRVLKKVAENPAFKSKLVRMGMMLAKGTGRVAAEAGEEGPQQIITDLATDSIKEMADNPQEGAAEAVGKNVAENGLQYLAKGAEAMKQAVIPAAGMILGGKVVETPFRLAAAQEAKKKAATTETQGPQPGPEDAEPVRDIEKFKQEWREAELPEEVITKLADNYARGDKAGEDAIIAEYEASQAAAAREAAKTPATATEAPPTPTQGPAPEGGKGEQAGAAASEKAAVAQTAPVKGQVLKIHDLPIKVETPAGEARKEGFQPLKDAYGHVQRTEGADGDNIDVFVNRDRPEGSDKVYVVDQLKKDGTPDEQKVIVGANSPAEAETVYRRNYPDDWNGFGGVKEYTPDEFKAWVKSEAAKEGEHATGPAIQVDRADGEVAPDTAAGAVRRDGESDTAGVEAARPPAPAKGTGVRASPDVQPQEKIKEKASEVVPEKPEVPQREREPASQLQEGHQAADEAPEPRQPDVLSRQAQPAATPTSTAGGVAGPTLRAEPVKSALEARARFIRGDKLYAFSEMDEDEPILITSEDMLNGYSAELIFATADAAPLTRSEMIQELATTLEDEGEKGRPEPKSLSPESAAKPQDTGREPTITASGDATREIYPQEFEDLQTSRRRKTTRTTEKVKARATLIEGPVDFALSDYPIPYLPRRAKDRTGGTRDPVNTVMSTLRYYAREGTMEQKRIARELLDRWTDESTRSPDEWYQEMAGSNPAVAGTDLGDFMANIVAPEIDRIMEGRELTPSDQFMDKEAEGAAEDAYRAAVEGMEAGSAAPDVFKQAPALAQIGTTAEKPYRIVYPEGTVEAYKDADGWHVRTNRLLPFRRVDGTKAGRAMAASLDARLAAAKGETDERSTEGVGTRRERGAAVMHAARVDDSNQPEAGASIGSATSDIGSSERDAVAVDGIPEDGAAQISGPANAPQMETVVDANTAERRSPARRGERDEGIGNKNKPEAGYERTQRDIAQTKDALRIATEHAEENLAALKDVYAKFDHRYNRLTVYTPAEGDVQWGYAAEFSRILGQELLPVSGLWTNGIRAPKLPGVSVVDAKNDFPIIVTTAHEISHGFDKQYDTGTNDPLTNPALALRKALDAQIGPEQIEGYVNGPGINWRPKWNSTSGNPVGRKLLEQEIRVEMRADFMGEAITQEKFWVKLFDISRKAFDLFSRFVNDIIDRVSVSPRLSVLPYFRDVEAAMDAAAAFYKHVIESKAERTAAASADLPFSAKREPNLFLQAKALEAQPPEGQEQHRFNVHVIDHKDIAPEVRERVAAHYYEVKPKKVTSDNAAAWLMKQGDTALAEAALFNEATDIPADERIASAILLHAKYADRAADEKLTKEERDAALDQMISMGNWIDNHFMQYGQAINQAKLHYHDLSTLRGSVANLQWTRRKANAAELQEVAPLAEAIAEVAEIERVQVEKQAEAIPEDMVAKAIYDEVVKRYRDLEQVNTRLHMRSSSKVLKALVDVIADPVRRNSPSLAEPNKKIEDREAKAMERLKAKMTGIQASEKRDLPGDDIIPEPDRSDLIDLTVGQIRKNGMADVVAFTKWMKDTFGTAYEGKEISSVWYDAVLLYGETVGPYLTGTSKAKHAKAKESIKKDRELQMDLPAQPSPFLGFSSEELSKYRKTELQGIIDQTRLRATGTTQPTAEETAQMDLQARADAPQGDIFPKELFLKAKAQDIIDLTKLSANAKAVFMAATTPDTTMAELYAQAGVPTEGVPYTNIIDTKLADLLTGPVMEKAIREHLRTWNESLARLAMQDATAGETLAGSLAKQLTATFGLTPYKASILEQAIRKKVVRMTDAARQKELKRVLKEKKVAKPRRGHRKAINEVLALANLGALDAQNINQVIAKKLGISTELTTEQVSELDRLSKAIRAANEGTPKNDATREAMRYIARQTGRNWWRVWTAQFYNNIFSAPPTTARNVAGTSINDLQETLVDLSMNPDAVIAMMKGKAKGVIPGFHELLAKLRGKTVQRAADKLEMPNDIEVNWPRAGLFFNFPTNFLTGQDLPFYTSAEHAALATLAFEEAKKTPGIGMAEATRVAMHRIYGSKEEQQAWVDQATTEYPGNSVAAKLDRKRRIHELMLMRLPQEWQTAMKEAGGRHSLNDELDPDSTITEAAKILTQFASRAMPVKFTVAIITMPARLLQRNLDYMGYGLVRAKFGHTQNWNWFTLGHRKPNLETPEQRDIHRRRAIFGIGFSLATNLLAALAAGVFEDDEDKKKKMQKRPWFSLNGPGPKSGEQRSQLRRTGWFPWSIGVQLPGSDKIRYYPMGLAGTMTLNLMMSGFVWDAIRYKSLKDTSATGWITATGLMGIRGMAEMSPIRNATRMLDAITAENTETAINQMTRQLAGTFDAMIVPYSAGVNWITKMIDPVNYESGSFVVELLKKTPAAAMVGKPAIDDLGYVVKGMYPVLWSTEKTDTAGKVWKLIVDNEAWIPRVGRPMITDQEFPAGRPITDEERYLMIKIRGQLLAREIEQNMSTYESKTQAEFQEAVDEKLSEYYDQAKTAIQRAAKDPSYDPEEVLK